MQIKKLRTAEHCPLVVILKPSQLENRLMNFDAVFCNLHYFLMAFIYPSMKKI